MPNKSPVHLVQLPSLLAYRLALQIKETYALPVIDEKETIQHVDMTTVSPFHTVRTLPLAEIGVKSELIDKRWVRIVAQSFPRNAGNSAIERARDYSSAPQSSQSRPFFRPYFPHVRLMSANRSRTSRIQFSARPAHRGSTMSRLTER